MPGGFFEELVEKNVVMLTSRPSSGTAGSHPGQQPRLLIRSHLARSLLPAFPKPATIRDVPPGVPSGWLAPQRSPGSVCSPSPETPKGARWRLPGLPARPANRNVFRLREFVRPNSWADGHHDARVGVHTLYNLYIYLTSRRAGCRGSTALQPLQPSTAIQLYKR